jgi:electron transport complex protein RnfC
LPIEAMPPPDLLRIPVHQHLGAPADPVAWPKSSVRIGQVIAEGNGSVSAAIHASVSGKVKKVDYYASAAAPRVLCIDIANDGEEEWADGANRTPVDVDCIPPEVARDVLATSGVVGMGGAAFPTHIKLSPPADVSIHTVILNGCECEPYLTSDDRLMVEHAPEIVKGMKILLGVLGVAQGYIGIESNKPEAIRAMREAALGLPMVKVVSLRTVYPQGAEKQLIRAILGREVPPGKLPFHLGVVVHNVGTAFAAWEAVACRKPLIERVVTVSGSAIERPANLRVRVGTMVSDVVDHCGGLRGDFAKLVVGGPMMGRACNRLDIPVTKATSGLLFLDRREAAMPDPVPCIRCASCVQVCPQGLMPCELASAVEHGQWERLDHIFDCVECGSCQFICPSFRPLVHLVRWGKAEARKRSEN